MANLTNKELIGISDQLNFEKVLECKYQTAAQESQDAQLQSKFQSLAGQHKQNFDTLLNFLR